MRSCCTVRKRASLPGAKLLVKQTMPGHPATVAPDTQDVVTSFAVFWYLGLSMVTYNTELYQWSAAELLLIWLSLGLTGSILVSSLALDWHVLCKPCVEHERNKHMFHRLHFD